MPNPWETGHLIQGQYLNSLQEAISDWSDNVLLQASGPAVVIPAATSAPAELVVGGQLRFANNNEHVILAGPSGLYNIYATTRRGTQEFDLKASPTGVTAQYSRLMGTAEFDGSNVTDVHSAIREINVSHIGGRAPSETPISEGIPAGRVDATLDPGWMDDLDAARVPVGGMREVWVPTPGVYAVPADWRVCNGQTVSAGVHGFDTPFAVTLPNMTNKHVLGASPFLEPSWLAGDDTGSPPGRHSTGGSNATQNLEHNHSRNPAGHQHALGAHTHVLPIHTHAQGQHFHTIDRAGDPFRLNIAAGGTHRTHVQADLGVGPSAPNTITNSVAVTSGGINTGGGSTTSRSGGASVPAGPTAVSLVPLSVGLVYMMRVV